jgi:hypothetical protein
MTVTVADESIDVRASSSSMLPLLWSRYQFPLFPLKKIGQLRKLNGPVFGGTQRRSRTNVATLEEA